MAICGYGLPAYCCQPAVAGGIIYADLWGELSTHVALHALFTQSSVRDATARSFPLSKHTGGGDTAPTFSGLCVYSSHGKWVFPPLLWHFPPTAAFTSFPAPDCWACAAAPASWHVCLQLTWEVGHPSSPVEFSLPPPLSYAFPLLVAGRAPLLQPSPARPSLFIYGSGRDSSPRLFGTQGTPPSLLCVFIVLIAYYSLSLFSPVGGQSVQKAMLIWPRVVCGSTVHHLAHLVVCVFPSCLGTGDWR
jgi:hypothetical protein